MSTTTPTATRVTYGNFMPTGRSGLMGLPMGVTIAAVPVVVLAIGLMTRGWFLAAIVVALAGLVAAALMLYTREGRTVYARQMLRRAHRAAERSGQTVYLAGPAGKVPDGSMAVPGLLAASVLSSHVDPFGNPFGLLRVPATEHYAVVLEAHPDGDALVDAERVEEMVAQWGAWLAQLGVDENVAGASVTVETADDPGVRLERMVHANLSPEGSAFAHEVAEQTAAALAKGSPITVTRIALTFSAKGNDRGPEAMAEDVANRLPVLLSGLFGTGAGTSVRACTAQDITDFTRVAYDPTVATGVEIARADGGTGLVWAEAGPSFAVAGLDSYRHDRAVSRTWQMWAAPSGIFYSTVLRRLLEPTAGVLRKRVTLLYRPVPASRAADEIEAELKNATSSGSEKRRKTARESQRERFATKASQEEAQGAGLVRFGMLVTVSCASSEQFGRLSKVIPGLGNQAARLRLREAFGNQAVAFQAALPLGLVLPEHSMLPIELREFL